MTASHQSINGQWITHQQGRVLLCCAYGLSMKQTAEKLCIAYKTVDGHHQKTRELYSVVGYHGLLQLGLKLLPELEEWLGTDLRPAGFG